MANDIYIQAYRSGNVAAVNALLKKQYPRDKDRFRILEMLDDSGLWAVGWQNVEVKAYLGD